MKATELSATDLASRIRDRSLSATEVVDAYLDVIERRGRELNAVVRIDAERARDRAHHADEALAAGHVWGPLHGIPYTLHEVIPVAGMGASAGSRASERTPAVSGAIAERLARSGAILLGKTNASVGLRQGGQLFDPTANPRDVMRTAGGVSAGPAAAVAAGMSAFDVALDLDGSLRVAAHFCGVFALRPTMHRIPVGGLIAAPPGWPRTDRWFSTVGPVARTAADLSLVLKIIAGQDSSDPEVAPVPVGDAPIVDVRGLRVATIPLSSGIPVARDIAGTIDHLSRTLASAGARVAEREPLPLAEVSAAFQRYVPILIAIATRAEPPRPSPLPTIAPPPTPYEAVMLADERDHMIAAYETFMNDFDVVIAPATNATAFLQVAHGAPIDVDGALAPASSLTAWSELATYLGVPAAVVPVGTDASGLPIGVQLIGRRWRDEHLLGVAAAIARLVGPLPAAR
jgi:amidase